MEQFLGCAERGKEDGEEGEEGEDCGKGWAARPCEIYT
jgi:hypothetical protein